MTTGHVCLPVSHGNESALICVSYGMMKLYHYCDIFRSLDSSATSWSVLCLCHVLGRTAGCHRARCELCAQLQHKTLNTFPARPMAPPRNPMTLERAVCAAPPDPVNDGSRGHPQLCARPCIRIAKKEDATWEMPVDTAIWAICHMGAA